MNYPLCLIQNPNNTWSFVGRVPVKLGWLTKDGHEVDDELAKKISAANVPSMIAKSRVFKTLEEALAEAKKMGLEVDQVLGGKTA